MPTALSTLPIHPLSRSPRARRSRLAYRIRNLPHRVGSLGAIREELKHLFRVGIRTELRAVVFRADGRVEDLGVVSRRVVSTAGVAFIAQAFTNAVEAESMNWHGSGTGVAAEAVSDTGLGAEVETRAAGTQSNPAGGQYRSVGLLSYTASRAITEHGLFSASTAGALLDRSVFAAINVQNLDQIQFTYTITFSAGG